MAEDNAFKGGSANGSQQNKPTTADAERRDEYMGQYKERADGVSEAEKFGTDQNPVQNDALPAKNLKGAGG